jgi:hypothetical protein
MSGSNLTPEQLLAEAEDVLQTMPPKATLRHDTPENQSWLGRAVALISRWNPDRGQDARAFLERFHDRMAVNSTNGYKGLMSLLHEAHHDLRLVAIGPVSTAIGQGQVFDYFDVVRKLVGLAKVDLLVVDPYLEVDFVSRFLPHVSRGVAIRLLSREKLAALVPATQLFQQQEGASIEIRSAPGFHDRYVFVDGASCYQSGASFKDGGRTAPTTVTQITDAFSVVRQTYEDLWQSASVVLRPAAAP